MTPNNNLSVLPWYNSIEQQNAHKWWAYGRVFPLVTQAMFMLPFQIIRPHRETEAITLFRVFTKDGALVGTYTQQINEAGIYFKSFVDFGYDVIVFPGLFPVFSSFPEGQYYAVISDGTQTWYSEVFNVVNDVSRFLKIEWWDDSDAVMDAGTIVYEDPAFKNLLYLNADIARPEYVFEEEGEERDGYFFPNKQVSEKRYHFTFLAPEFLLDVMRFIRMSDNIVITKDGQSYRADTFLITPEWQGDGDIASVDATFDTNTATKKLGVGYIRAERKGDFNNDFSNDFDNQ
jgi:hypothetical protein